MLHGRLLFMPQSFRVYYVIADYLRNAYSYYLYIITDEANSARSDTKNPPATKVADGLIRGGSNRNPAAFSQSSAAPARARQSAAVVTGESA